MKKYLILFIIFIIAISVIAVSAKTIYVIKDSEGNNVAVTDQGFLSYEQIEKGYTIEVLMESDESQVQSPKKSEPQLEQVQNTESDSNEAFIEETDVVVKYDEFTNLYFIQGIVKNTGNTIADYVKVKVRSVDIDEKLISIDEAYVDPYTLEPGQEATYEVIIEYDENIDGFIREFQWEY